MPEGPHLHAVRRAVRAWFDEHRPGRSVVVGLSGGADSLALTAACVAEDVQVHAVVVDHGLQAGSAEVARRAADQARDLGCARAEVTTVSVDRAGGPEAAARRARYAALDSVRGDRPILLGHTLDDQAETVLLGLGRGSGPRSIRGMAAWKPPRGRPLLTVRRADTVGACEELGLAPWNDPHNADPSFVRVRLRREVLPLLEDVLQGGVAGALARTADRLREDGAVLDALAADIAVSARDGDALDVSALVDVAPALRRRVIGEWLGGRGVPLRNEAQVRAVDDLVGAWRGQGGVAVAGGGPTATGSAIERLVVERRHGKLDLVRWTGRATSE